MDRLHITTMAVRWLMLAVAVYAAARLVDGIHLDGVVDTLLVALILGLLNLYLRPLLFFLTLPLTILTLGFFLLVLNAILLALTSWLADLAGLRFHVDGFWDALLGALVITLVSLLLGIFVKPDRIARDLTGRRW